MLYVSCSHTNSSMLSAKNNMVGILMLALSITKIGSWLIPYWQSAFILGAITFFNSNQMISFRWQCIVNLFQFFDNI